VTNRNWRGFEHLFKDHSDEEVALLSGKTLDAVRLKRFRLGPEAEFITEGATEDERNPYDEIKALKNNLSNQAKELSEARKLLGVLETIDSTVVKAPRWTVKTPSKRGRLGIVTLQLSDTHFDEVVNPQQVAYINAYNRDIAEQRLRRWVEKSVVLARDYIAGVQIEGAAILATGDILSGNIHAELKESNESTLYESAEHWIGQLYSAIDTLATEFGKVHIAAVVGNHGRDSHKPVYKNRAQSNIEWLMWRVLAREFAKDDRVTFKVSDAIDEIVQLYGTKYLITHGDEFKGGSGIQGARAPLSLGVHRTSVRQMATDNPMDWMVVGHFHQYQAPSQGLIMGGSLKGYDEYAFGKRLRPEDPIQGFWITSPEWGPTLSAPVHVGDRDEEGW
jgi:predicted phosphodiesterase